MHIDIDKETDRQTDRQDRATSELTFVADLIAVVGPAATAEVLCAVVSLSDGSVRAAPVPTSYRVNKTQIHERLTEP